jgi:hypothetical protein
MENPKSKYYQIQNKHQASSTKFQISFKSQFSKFQTASFVHWKFGHWDLFGIWNLGFGILLCLVLGMLPGCASMKEVAKGIAGVSTKALEEGRKEAIVSTFSLDYASCFARTQETLKEEGAYIYSGDIKKHMIAFYVSEADTTAVGVFFNEIEPNSIQMEVSSLSTYAKELFAEKIFEALKPKVRKETHEEKPAGD